MNNNEYIAEEIFTGSYILTEPMTEEQQKNKILDILDIAGIEIDPNLEYEINYTDKQDTEEGIEIKFNVNKLVKTKHDQQETIIYEDETKMEEVFTGSFIADKLLMTEEHKKEKATNVLKSAGVEIDPTDKLEFIYEKKNDSILFTVLKETKEKVLYKVVSEKIFSGNKNLNNENISKRERREEIFDILRAEGIDLSKKEELDIRDNKDAGTFEVYRIKKERLEEPVVEKEAVKKVEKQKTKKEPVVEKVKEEQKVAPIDINKELKRIEKEYEEAYQDLRKTAIADARKLESMDLLSDQELLKEKTRSTTTKSNIVKKLSELKKEKDYYESKINKKQRKKEQQEINASPSLIDPTTNIEALFTTENNLQSVKEARNIKVRKKSLKNMENKITNLPEKIVNSKSASNYIPNEAPKDMVEVYEAKKHETESPEEIITREVFHIYQDISDNNQKYADSKTLEKFEIKPENNPTMINEKACYKINDNASNKIHKRAKRSKNPIIEIETVEVKLENKNIEETKPTVVPTEEKPLSITEILAKLTKDLDSVEIKNKEYSISNANVSTEFKEELQSEEVLYNIIHKGAVVDIKSLGILKELPTNLISKTNSELKEFNKRLNELDDTELEILRKDYDEANSNLNTEADKLIQKKLKGQDTKEEDKTQDIAKYYGNLHTILGELKALEEMQKNDALDLTDIAILKNEHQSLTKKAESLIDKINETTKCEVIGKEDLENNPNSGSKYYDLLTEEFNYISDNFTEDLSKIITSLQANSNAVNSYRIYQLEQEEKKKQDSNLDFTKWSYNDSYQAINSKNKTFSSKFHEKNLDEINEIITDYSTKSLDQKEALSKINNIVTENENDLSKVTEEILTILKENKYESLDEIKNSLDYLVNNKEIINTMDKTITRTESLEEIPDTYRKELVNLPSNVVGTLICSLSATAVMQEVSKEMKPKHNKKKSTSNPDDILDAYLNMKFEEEEKPRVR